MAINTLPQPLSEEDQEIINSPIPPPEVLRITEKNGTVWEVGQAWPVEAVNESSPVKASDLIVTKIFQLGNGEEGIVRIVGEGRPQTRLQQKGAAVITSFSTTNVDRTTELITGNELKRLLFVLSLETKRQYLIDTGLLEEDDEDDEEDEEDDTPVQAEVVKLNPGGRISSPTFFFVLYF